MRELVVNLNEIQSKSLDIGYVGEQDHTRVVIVCSSMFSNYPDAVATMVAKPPVGDIYPIVLTRDESCLIWDVSPSDVANSGSGTFQLTFTQGTEIIKTAYGSFSVKQSMIAEGDPPEPLEDWLEEAQKTLSDLQAIDSISNNATVSDIGKALSPKTVSDGKVTEWQFTESGGGGTSDYSDLTNKPQIAGVTLSGNKTLSDLGIASESDVSAKYTKPQTGIPASDLESGVIPDVSGFYTKPSGGIPATDIADGVIPTVHNVPAGGSTGEVLKKVSGTDYDLEWGSTAAPTDAQVESAVTEWLDDHPDATTTVQDGAVTWAKLNNSVHEYINGAYTYTADDVESGSWSYASKTANAKRLRNKVQIPVHKGMRIEFTNPTLQIDIAIYKTTGTYIQNTGWLGTSSTERTVTINTDGWLVILHQSTNNITVSDYDSTVKLYSYPTSKATDVEVLASDMLMNMADDSEMPILYWKAGGMYGASGIEYSSDARSITQFVPVKPGELLTIYPDVSNMLVLFQFASCVHSDTNVNNIVCSTIDIVGQTTIKLDNSANYIRLMVVTTPDVISGHVAVFHEKRSNGVFNHTYTLTESDIVNGTYSTNTGAVVANSTRIRYKGILHVEAGASVHFVPGETTTDFWCAYRSNTSDTFSNYGWKTAETEISFNTPTDIVLAFAKTDRTVDILPEDFDCTVTVTTPVVKRSLKTYVSLDALKNDTSIQIGQIVQTLGFNTPNDFGGGIYEVVYYSSAEPDNCVLFATANDRVQLKRIFTDPFVYLESLNYANVEYSLINTVIQRNSIGDVRCATITTDKTIAIKDYDFTFGFITYTGNDCAILLDGVQCHKIYGNLLTADNAEFGVKVTCTSQSCYRNIIEINQIKVKDHGLAVRPVNTHGVQHNHYRINYIRAYKTGFSCYIPSGTGAYSWEGEELLTLNQILATNDDGDANAVHLEIEPDPETGETLDGTITGLTFTNLSTESSDNGVYIHCGEYSSHSPHLYNACIKSIIINNMRTREDGWTYNFLYGSGYIRDVYVKPTTVLRFSQVNLVSSVGSVPVRIDCPVFYNYMMTDTGYGISSRVGKKYFTKRKGGIMTVTDDIDFSVFGLDHVEEEGKTLFYPDQFYIDDSVLGSSVHINLNYLMDESADGIIYSIPGKSGNNVATVEAEYMNPHKTLTLTNNNADRHLYQVKLMQGRNWQTDWEIQIIDLGVADNEITLPYNYDEDNP